MSLLLLLALPTLKTELHRLLGVSKGSLHFHLRVLEENCVVTRSYRLSSDKPALMSVSAAMRAGYS